MRITVRGWSRDVGETVILSEGLDDAEEPAGSYSKGKLYKRVVDPDNKRWTRVQISSGIDVRLGGSYLMHVELSRKEIGRLFFETHNGAMVRMIKSFIDDEEREEALQALAAIRERSERRKRIAEEIAAEQSEGGDPAE